MTQENAADTEYRRDDLPPTLEQALEVPEIKAMVEALRSLTEYADRGSWPDRDPVQGARAALAALEGFDL